MTNAQDMNTALDNPHFSLQHIPTSCKNCS